MTAATDARAAPGFRVIHFEFGYMADRRTSGSRRPLPRADRLNGEYVSAANYLECRGPLIIGGKSMGGRVASLLADDLHEAGKISRLLCLGYPFQPPASTMPQEKAKGFGEKMPCPVLVSPPSLPEHMYSWLLVAVAT